MPVARGHHADQAPNNAQCRTIASVGRLGAELGPHRATMCRKCNQIGAKPSAPIIAGPSSAGNFGRGRPTLALPRQSSPAFDYMLPKHDARAELGKTEVLQFSLSLRARMDINGVCADATTVAKACHLALACIRGKRYSSPPWKESKTGLRRKERWLPPCARSRYGFPALVSGPLRCRCEVAGSPLEAADSPPKCCGWSQLRQTFADFGRCFRSLWSAINEYPPELPSHIYSSNRPGCPSVLRATTCSRPTQICRPNGRNGARLTT